MARKWHFISAISNPLAETGCQLFITINSLCNAPNDKRPDPSIYKIYRSQINWLEKKVIRLEMKN